MAKRPDTTLDRTLENFKRSALAISKVVAVEAKALQQGDYELPVLVNAAERHTRTLSLLIEAAPFLQTKQQIEATESFKQWILDSIEFTGEVREQILDALTTYQQQVLAKTGYYTPKTTQMTLL